MAAPKARDQEDADRRHPNRWRSGAGGWAKCRNISQPTKMIAKLSAVTI